MRDLDQHIRMVLDDRYPSVGIVSKAQLTGALGAVLDLHQPYVYSALTGVICGADDHPDAVSVPYPCPTVQAVATHLGLTQETTMTDLTQPALGAQVHAVADLLDRHRLRPVHLMFGVGAPCYVDVIVETWQAVGNWAGALELTDIRADNDGRSVARGMSNGFNWTIMSREQYRGVL